MQAEATESIVVTRVLRAPVAKVFKAWTDPSILAKWFFPNERWVRAEAEVELVPGGKYNTSMVHSDGDVFRHEGQIVEIEQDKKIAFTWQSMNGPDQDRVSFVTVTLEPCPEGTNLTLNHSKLPAGEEPANYRQGWEGCLTTLSAYFEKEQN